MKKLMLLLFCANAIFVSGFAMETKGYQKLKEDDGLEEKSKDKNLTRLVPWEKMPLTRIARTGNIGKLTKALNSRPDADINAKTISGLPPLHLLVVSSKWHELKEVIRKYKPEIDIKDNEGKTVLFKLLLDSSDDHVACFQYFVHKLNASLTVKDKSKNTLLHEAAIRNNPRMMGELLSACSVKLNLLPFARLLAAKNENGETALDIAIKKTKETNDDKMLQKLCFVIKDLGKQISDRKKEVEEQKVKMEEQKAKIDKRVHATKKVCNEILSLAGKMSQLSVSEHDVDSDGDEYYEPLGELPPIEEDGSLWLL